MHIKAAQTRPYLPTCMHVDFFLSQIAQPSNPGILHTVLNY